MLCAFGVVFALCGIYRQLIHDKFYEAASAVIATNQIENTKVCYYHLKLLVS